MSTNIVPFAFGEHEVRVIMSDGAPWFVASDVARVLGYRDANNLARRIDDDDKGTRSVSTPGGEQQVTVISEPGLYAAVLGSQVAGARMFKRWVAHEVIPSIRKTGSYGRPAIDITSPEGILELAQNFTKTAQALVESNATIAILEPKAAQTDMFREADGLRSIGDLANDLKVHAASNFPGVKVYNQDVFDLAGDLGLIIRGNTVRHNQPTAKAIEAGWVKPKDFEYETTSHGKKVSVITRLTPRGYGRVWDAAVTNLKQFGTVRAPKKGLAA